MESALRSGLDGVVLYARLELQVLKRIAQLVEKECSECRFLTQQGTYLAFNAKQ
jgi:hypothetical protein